MVEQRSVASDTSLGAMFAFQAGFDAVLPCTGIDPASLSAEQLDEVESFLAALDANDDVQHVYAGLAG